MPVRHLDLLLLEKFAAARLRPEEMIQAGRHLSSCFVCRTRLRRGIQNGEQLLKRLRLDDQQAPSTAEYEDLFERLSVSTAQRVLRIQHEKSHVPELLAEFAGLAPADQPVFTHEDSRFHTAAFVDALLENARNLWAVDQSRSEWFAELGLGIAERLDQDLYGNGLISDLKARSWAFVANARRIHADFRGAEEAFRAAEELLREGSGDPLEWARLLDLKASLRRAQRRFEEALGLLDEVAGIYRKTHERHLEGRTLISKALIYEYAEQPELALPLLFDALEKIDRQKEPRLLFNILQNLTLTLVALGDLEHAGALLPQARQAAIDLGTADDLIRTLWVEGLLDLGLLQFAAAEAKLQAVRSHYAEVGIGYNAALASLDLAKVYLQQGRTAETKRLAAEMHPIFASLEVQREAIAALLVFQHAAEQETASLRLVEEVIRSVRRIQAGPLQRPERPT